MRRLALTAAVLSGISGLACAQTQAGAEQAQLSPAFQQGSADRQGWEDWFGRLTGDYRSGAAFWSGHRSIPNPGSCYGPAGQNLGDWTAGCVAAQQRLAVPDVRRKAEPDYWQGWNRLPTLAANPQRPPDYPQPQPQAPTTSAPVAVQPMRPMPQIPAWASRGPGFNYAYPLPPRNAASCKDPRLRSPGATNWLNGKVYQPDGPRSFVASIDEPTGNNTAVSLLSCHVVLTFEDGTRQPGMLTIEDLGPGLPLRVRWRPDEESAAEAERKAARLAQLPTEFQHRASQQAAEAERQATAGAERKAWQAAHPWETNYATAALSEANEAANKYCSLHSVLACSVFRGHVLRCVDLAIDALSSFQQVRFWMRKGESAETAAEVSHGIYTWQAARAPAGMTDVEFTKQEFHACLSNEAG